MIDIFNYNKNLLLELVLKFMLCFMIAFSGSNIYAQDRYAVLEYAEETKLKDPEDAVEVAKSILKQPSSRLDCKVYLFLSDTYMLLEAYDLALDAIQSIYRQSCELDSLELFYITLLETVIYQKLEIDSHKIIAEKQLKQILDQDISGVESEFMIWAKQVLDIKSSEKTLSGLKIDVFNYNPESYLQHLNMRAYVFIEYLSLLWLNPTEQNKEQLQTYIEYYEIDEEKWFYAKIAEREVASLLKIEQTAEAIDLLKETVSYLDYTSFLSYTKYAMVNQLLANSTYIQNKELALYYRDLSAALGNQIQKIEVAAINSIHRFTSEKYEEELEDKLNSYIYYKNGIWLFSALVFIIMGSWWLRIKRHERYNNEIYQYLSQLSAVDNTAYQQKDIETLSQSIAKSSKLSDEVVSEIIAGLKQFEVDGGYIDNNISLSSLSARLEVNTKYLSEVLNTHLEESFNAYINRLRIEYIVKKLKDDPKYLKYKISYIAEVAGYSSHSSFSTAFKNITGVSPTKFISYLKKEI